MMGKGELYLIVIAFICHRVRSTRSMQQFPFPIICSSPMLKAKKKSSIKLLRSFVVVSVQMCHAVHASNRRLEIPNQNASEVVHGCSPKSTTLINKYHLQNARTPSPSPVVTIRRSRKEVRKSKKPVQRSSRPRRQ